jgi:chromatin segregation and condensation protein Rec8/ScpA/Scc1 (kleisin family)|tara:strand:+ start:202 stop:657 length:456 start_codon:yes stop_codon:yes gene_type:complete
VADLEKLKTQVALLEKDAQSAELIHQRLETAIEKLTEITISLKGMLVQQETKLAKAEETDNDIFITLESRRLEWDNDLKDLHSRITTNSRELREHQVQSESKMLYELRNLRQQLDNRVAVLEKWRWIIVGGSIIVGLMVSNPDSMLMQLLR